MSAEAWSACKKVKAGGLTNKAVLIELANVADERGGNIFASYGYIAKVLECSERTIMRAVAELIELKLIILVADRPGTSKMYKINPEVMSGNWAHPCQIGTPDKLSPLPDCQEGPDKLSPPPLTDCHTPPDKLSPDKEIKRDLKEEKECGRACFEELRQVPCVAQVKAVGEEEQIQSLVRTIQRLEDAHPELQGLDWHQVCGWVANRAQGKPAFSGTNVTTAAALLERFLKDIRLQFGKQVPVATDHPDLDEAVRVMFAEWKAVNLSKSQALGETHVAAYSRELASNHIGAQALTANWKRAIGTARFAPDALELAVLLSPYAKKPEIKVADYDDAKTEQSGVSMEQRRAELKKKLGIVEESAA